MTIVTRYLWKEVGNALLAVTGILLLILFSNMLVHYLSHDALLPLALKLSILRLPYYIGMLLPVGIYFAILLSFGRLFVDHEMVILTSSGMSWWQITRIVLTPTLMTALVVTCIMLWVNPILAEYQYRLIDQYKQTAVGAVVDTGLQQSLDGHQVLYVQRLSDDNKTMHRVSAIMQTKNGISIIYAPTAHQYFSAQGDRYIHLNDGQRYDFTQHRLTRIINFKTYDAQLRKASLSPPSKTVRTIGVTHLWRLNTPNALAELQWRFSIPLAVVVLALLAIPLSQVPPRQGRYGRLFPAILIFSVYFNALTICKNMITSQTLPPWPGIAAVHGTFLLIALGFILYRNKGNRWHMRHKTKRTRTA